MSRAPRPSVDLSEIRVIRRPSDSEKPVLRWLYVSINGADRAFHALDVFMANLKSGDVIDGDVDLSEIGRPLALPDGLTFNDSLQLTWSTGLKALPDNLVVKGSLNLTCCRGLASFPLSLSVGCDLAMSYCASIRTLPDKFRIPGFLDARHCSSLMSLPEGLSVGGFLDIRCCPRLRHLPYDLDVGGGIGLNVHRAIPLSGGFLPDGTPCATLDEARGIMVARRE